MILEGIKTENQLGVIQNVNIKVGERKEKNELDKKVIVRARKEKLRKKDQAKMKNLTSSKKKNNVENDFKLYFIVCIIYLIGILAGAIYFRLIINNAQIRDEISHKFSLIETNQELTKTDVLRESIIKNTKQLISFWIIGVSVVGSPFLMLICLYKGFSVAFTISTALINLGFLKGNIFVFRTLFMHTIFVVLAMFILVVSSLKVSINVLKNKKDVRLEIVRHSIVSLVSIIFFVISIFFETMFAI